MRGRAGTGAKAKIEAGWAIFFQQLEPIHPHPSRRVPPPRPERWFTPACDKRRSFALLLTPAKHSRWARLKRLFIYLLCFLLRTVAGSFARRQFGGFGGFGDIQMSFDGFGKDEPGVTMGVNVCLDLDLVLI